MKLTFDEVINKYWGGVPPPVGSVAAKIIQANLDYDHNEDMDLDSFEYKGDFYRDILANAGISEDDLKTKLPRFKMLLIVEDILSVECSYRYDS